MEVLNIEIIESTCNSMGANILSLDSVLSIEDQNELFGDDESIILEF